jgi:hypothetical protein
LKKASKKLNSALKTAIFFSRNAPKVSLSNQEIWIRLLESVLIVPARPRIEFLLRFALNNVRNGADWIVAEMEKRANLIAFGEFVRSVIGFFLGIFELFRGKKWAESVHF